MVRTYIMLILMFMLIMGIFGLGSGIIMGSPQRFFAGVVLVAIPIFWLYYQMKIKPQKEKREQEAERQAQLSEQSALEQKQRTLAYLEGLEKFHTMDVADAEAYKEGIEAMRLVGMLMQESVYQEKKNDWSIVGGIADGIAGPAAGISAAVNTINENAKIDAENAARREWGKKQNAHYQDLANQAAAQRPHALTISELQKKYTAIMAWSPDTLFSIIKFKTPTVAVDDVTGAVTVTVDWEQNDRSLCIDGAIRAKLYSEKGKCSGCAFLVLPKVGTSKFKGRLSGICSMPKQANQYNVVLEPINLWELASTNNPSYRKCDNLTYEQHQKIVQRYDELFEAEMNR